MTYLNAIHMFFFFETVPFSDDVEQNMSFPNQFLCQCGKAVKELRGMHGGGMGQSFLWASSGLLVYGGL